MMKILLLAALFGQILLSGSPVTAQGSGPCKFPFIYKNIAYSACTTVDDPDGKPWCSTQTDNKNQHIQGKWKSCPEIKTPGGCLTYPDKKPGDCILIRQCSALSSLLQQGSDRGIQILRKSVCANDGSNVRVCCPRKNTNPVTRPTTTATQPTTGCGESAVFQKIVGGTNAKLASWPWMVIFRGRQKQRFSGSCRDSHTSCSGWAARGECQRNSAFMNANCKSSCNKCPSASLGPLNWFCGGVLITDRYVLTAAHCFVSVQIDFVRIGEYDLTKSPDKGQIGTAPEPQDIDAENVIIHPRYKKPCLRCNDIALVKLAKPATLDPIFVVPICLPSNPVRDMGFSAAQFQNQLGWATGWGVTNAADIFGTKGSDILQQVNLTIQELPFCSERKKSYPDGRMILCAGQGDGKDVCRADSGGPIMLSDQFATKWFVVGVTSFGATICGDSSAQGIFTSVHHYIDWINSKVL